MVTKPTEMPLPSPSRADAGSSPLIRPLAEADLPNLFAFIRGLSFATRYFRFGHGDYDPAQHGARQACLLAPEQGVHLIALACADDGEVVVGSARYVIQPGKTSGEFAIAVADGWKHHGIGHQLMDALSNRARTQGLHNLFGRILESNRDMIEFVRSYGFGISDSPEGPWQKIAVLNL